LVAGLSHSVDCSPEYTSHNTTDLLGSRCTCDVTIDIEEDFGDDEVFMYYGLNNYYQVLRGVHY
jgi:hypothetical protein